VLWLGTDAHGVVRFDENSWLGINNERNEMEISIYPNPFMDLLNIMSSSSINSISIYDMTGKMIMNRKIEAESKVNLETHQFAEGIYSVKVEMKTGVVRRQMIKVGDR
jgi:hypothetical protein